MLIGLRLLLIFAVLAAGASVLAYLFTRNPKFLALTKRILLFAAAAIGVVALVFVLERLLLAI